MIWLVLTHVLAAATGAGIAAALARIIPALRAADAAESDAQRTPHVEPWR